MSCSSLPTPAVLRADLSHSLSSVPQAREYNRESTWFPGTVYCIKICVHFLLETRGRLMGGGGALSYPRLNYEDIIYMKWYKLMAVGKCPGYNYFLSSVDCESRENLQSCLTGFFLCLVHHFYIRWELSTQCLW